MKIASWPIIFLLIFALLAQNTCLHGFAGKSSLVRECGHCPSKQVSATVPDGQKALSSSEHQPTHIPMYPMYVFDVPQTAPSFVLQRIRASMPDLIDDYKDPLPDELLKPPRA